MPSGRRHTVGIVGAGPAGTTLALGLLRQGHAVTLLSDRSGDDIRRGSVMSSQVTFESALAVQRELGVTALVPEAPAITAMSYDTVRLDGSRASFLAPLQTPARSLDQRLMLPALLAEIERLGARVVVRSATVDDVEALAAECDLVVVSTGRGELASLFPLDAARSPYTSPQRVAALTYLRGVDPACSSEGSTLRYHSVEGVGECFTCSALTTTGPCDIFVVEGVPGGPLDCWEDVRSCDQHLERLRRALADHFPQEAERVARAELADDNAVLRGRFTPVVRSPVATLPSGAQVLGMADAVVLNDPLTSQGANNATKSAATYLDAILAQEGDFDPDWMRRTFEGFWAGWASWATAWTGSWLRPAEPHQRKVVDAAAVHPGVAARIVAGFDDARLFHPWWFDAPAADAFLADQLASERSGFDALDLRRALGQYATGVTVVTTQDADGGRWGMTANSFTSVSLNPPLVLWAAAKSSPSMPAFAEATRFAVNVLAAHQHHLSRQFSVSGGDKFTGIALVPPQLVADELVADPPGASRPHPPVLEGTVAHFVCRRTQTVDAGDHVVFFGEIESYAAPGGEPLVFHSGSYRLTTKHPDL